MTVFKNLEQRMTNAYLDMFPPFHPLPDAGVSIQSQEQFYRFMQSVFQTVFHSPELFFKKINEDDAYPNRYNRASYGKPKLNDIMKKDTKEIDEFLACLYSLGQSGEVVDDQMVLTAPLEIKKRQLSLLPMFGLNLEGNTLSCRDYPGMFPAWKWMATRENANLITFSRCMFDPEYPYMQEIYSRLFGDPHWFNQLTQYLNKKNYTACDQEIWLKVKDYMRGPFSLDFVKKIVDGEVPLGNPLHGDPNHYGITADYTSYAVSPAVLILRILDMKNLLIKFDQMPDRLKEFVITYIKECDLCGYCTQTDKTGKRQPIFINVAYNGGRKICPLYPGFSFSFTHLNEALVSNLIAFLDFMDNHLKGKPLTISNN